jgi:hypothetical protein
MGDPSNTTHYMLLYVNIQFNCTLRQHVSTLSRGHPQAVEKVFIKAQDVRLPNGIPLDTVYIQGYKKMEYIELQKLFIIPIGLDRP